MSTNHQDAPAGGSTKPAEKPVRRVTPSWIVSQLEQYVIGQDAAKRTLAVVVYAHYRKLARASGPVEIAKSNVLLVGPTGTGKTLLCETLSKTLKLPFVTVDATSLAQASSLHDEVDAFLQRLIDRAGGDPAKAQSGIVFIDEVDKLKAGENQAQRHSGESVQHALLKLMESAVVRLNSGQVIDTRDILFICGGAFVGLENITAGNQAFGFVATTGKENRQILDRLNARIKPTDLFSYGLIPEFVGRLPVVASFHALSRQHLIRIMSEPKNSIYSQFRAILANEGVELTVRPPVFEQIADLAVEYKVGARGLRGIFEDMISPVLYAIPDRPAVRAVVIESLFEDARLLEQVDAATPG